MNNSLKTKQQLEEEVVKFVENIQQSAWEDIPTLGRISTGNNYSERNRQLLSEKWEQNKQQLLKMKKKVKWS